MIVKDCYKLWLDCDKIDGFEGINFDPVTGFFSYSPYGKPEIQIKNYKILTIYNFCHFVDICFVLVSTMCSFLCFGYFFTKFKNLRIYNFCNHLNLKFNCLCCDFLFDLFCTGFSGQMGITLIITKITGSRIFVSITFLFITTSFFWFCIICAPYKSQTFYDFCNLL